MTLLIAFEILKSGGKAITEKVICIWPEPSVIAPQPAWHDFHIKSQKVWFLAVKDLLKFGLRH